MDHVIIIFSSLKHLQRHVVLSRPCFPSLAGCKPPRLWRASPAVAPLTAAGSHGRGTSRSTVVGVDPHKSLDHGSRRRDFSGHLNCSTKYCERNACHQFDSDLIQVSRTGIELILSDLI
ncbi:hypothetical protein BS78_03G167800 [Paspalum vaginatum]|nr:hypothetical protein BS78_03G167800 [Paspalum vaginatum]